MELSRFKLRFLELIILVFIIVLSSIFRFTGTNWDQFAHLHPDERYITMVATAIKWPKDFSTYLDPQTSPLSPSNNNFGSYIYGTFPLFFVKYVADNLEMGDYNNLTIVGRTISAVVDTGNLLLIYFIGNNIYKRRLGLLAALFYAIAVMPIQQSHFFTTDTYETFFILITFSLFIIFLRTRSPLTNTIISLGIGVSMGLALASKISAAVFGLLVGLTLFMKFLQQLKRFSLPRNIFYCFDFTLLIALTIYIVFRLAQPYIFASGNWFDVTLSKDFQSALDFQRIAIKGEVMYPPQWNWVGTTPYLFPLSNIFVWGLGIPMSIAVIIGILSYFYEQILFLKHHYHIKQLIIPLTSPLLLLTVWVIGDFAYRGGNFVKTFRYLLAIIPFLTLFAALGVYQLKKTDNRLFFAGVTLVLVPTLLWATAFTSIYTRTTTRIAASEWIYANVNPDSTIATEHWDDGIPFRSTGPAPFEYPNGIALEVYRPDDQEKIPYLYEELSHIDYIFVTSDRARKNIGELPEDFPIMVEYYKALDNGTLGFSKVAEFSSYPKIFDIEINDSEAEETFWVYDHPTVRIYKKERSLSAAAFECILRACKGND